MKTLSIKETKCTSIKILIEKDDVRHEIVSDMKKKGYKVTSRPNFYTESMQTAEKHTHQGTVITFVKYERLV